jgi:hypothetical protein
MSEAIAMIRNDENLREALGETYAGDGETYADRLDAATSLPQAWALLIDAASIARMSGDYVAADTIREATTRIMKLADTGAAS